MTNEINNVAVRDLRSLARNDVGASGGEQTPGLSMDAPANPSSKASKPLADVSPSDKSGDPKPAAGLDSEALAELANETSEKFQALDRQLQFEVAEQSGRTVITVMDRESGDVIRSIPPEKLLEVSQYLSQIDPASPSAQLSGILLSDKVVA